MNLLAYPCTKTAKIIVIRSREPENAVRKISYRRSLLHKIFKNYQNCPFFLIFWPNATRYVQLMCLIRKRIENQVE